MTPPADIILVEDDPMDALLFRRSIEPLVRGSIHVAPRAAGILPALEGARPWLVVTDLKLPGGDGVSVIQAIRRKSGFSKLPVVVCSSSGQPDDIARSYAAGANAYVRKPHDLDGWSDLADRLVGFWRDMNLTAH